MNPGYFGSWSAHNLTFFYKMSNQYEGLPLGFQEDLKVPMLVWKQRWKSILPFIEEWKYINTNFLFFLGKKITNCFLKTSSIPINDIFDKCKEIPNLKSLKWFLQVWKFWMTPQWYSTVCVHVSAMLCISLHVMWRPSHCYNHSLNRVLRLELQRFA